METWKSLNVKFNVGPKKVNVSIGYFILRCKCCLQESRISVVIPLLRLLTECFIVVRSAMCGAIFNLVIRVGVPSFFGTPKSDSLKINSLPSNICISHRNVLYIATTLCQIMVLKELYFSKKSIFVHFGLYDLVQILPACCPNAYQILYEETSDFQC